VQWQTCCDKKKLYFELEPMLFFHHELTKWIALYFVTLTSIIVKT